MVPLACQKKTFSREEKKKKGQRDDQDSNPVPLVPCTRTLTTRPPLLSLAAPPFLPMDYFHDRGQRSFLPFFCCYGNRKLFFNNAHGPNNHHAKFEIFRVIADFIKILEVSDFP